MDSPSAPCAPTSRRSHTAFRRQRSSPLPARQTYAAKDQRKADDVKHPQWLAEQADCEQRPKQRDHVQKDAAAVGTDQFDATREANVGDNAWENRNVADG